MRTSTRPYQEPWAGQEPRADPDVAVRSALAAMAATSFRAARVTATSLVATRAPPSRRSGWTAQSSRRPPFA